jgi:hypothetical protein
MADFEWGSYFVTRQSISRSRFLCPDCARERSLFDENLDLIETFDPANPPRHPDCSDCARWAPVEEVPSL